MHCAPRGVAREGENNSATPAHLIGSFVGMTFIQDLRKPDEESGFAIASLACGKPQQ
jgi:hypothetical protein